MSQQDRGVPHCPQHVGEEGGSCTPHILKHLRLDGAITDLASVPIQLKRLLDELVGAFPEPAQPPNKTSLEAQPQQSPCFAVVFDTAPDRIHMICNELDNLMVEFRRIFLE